MPARWLATDDLERLAGEQEAKREAFEAGASWWTAWNSGYSMNLSTTTSSTMGIEPTWGAWNVTFTSTTGSTVLYDASSNNAMIPGTTPQWTYWNTDYQETEDQRAERERLQAEREADWRRRHEEQQRERDTARARAEELLRSLLSDDQWASYQENGWFEVRGSSGRRWRIRNRGQSGNVDLMPEIGEEREATYCAHPPGGLPDADAHAAQMLALVTDEEAFTRVANVHYRNPAREAERAERLRATQHERVHVGREPWGEVRPAA